ncbi:hypothetical protein EDD90_10375 [Streptomyces sp. Ag109_O5-1]|uniref:helix-turn-helix domain-containing protein n=1 Tax=Streptomyces sp. Ag109_O5-1 TaxID=1938851 RepID=UPI000F4E3604|nr:hypothetical protein EDD90_10375 [Streptomyces sp. Ag109_O5-1]
MTHSLLRQGLSGPSPTPKSASVRTLAAGGGRSYGFVHRLPTEADTTIRTRGGPNVSDWPAN